MGFIELIAKILLTGFVVTSILFMVWLIKILFVAIW